MIVVDASVVVKWFTLEPLHEEARALLLGADHLLAPDIVTVEVANALWAKAGRGEISEPASSRAVAALAGGGQPQLRPSTPLVPHAFELARRLDHPVYGCLYLALAEERDARLVTADARFATTAASQAVQRIQRLGS
ncbi:MAG TPA: type II toxin-antitoxin system VapC family toxin [Egibacteraceae bacterium]|nr:type II toxin-antitoxin system VapC family toxin [Egibacteraceae bacterium]